MRLRNLVFFAPDDAGAGSGSPAPETPETEQDPAAAPEPETPAAPAEEPAPEAAPESEDEAEDEAPRLTPEQYEAELARVRKQAGNYRVERNTLKAEVAQLREQLAAAQAAPAPPAADPAAEAEARAQAAERRALRAELAGELGLSVATLRAVDALAQAGDEAALREALTTLRAQLGSTSTGAAPPPAAPPNPTPPERPATPPTLDEQIKAAEAAGDHVTAIRLKNQKVRSLHK